MLIVSLPTIVAFYVQSFVYVPSLSSPLLLRISPNTFAFISILSMSLSSRNRSNSKAFRHILPCIAPVCEGMHYHKTGVPWQMKSIFIMFSYLHFCSVFLLKSLILQDFSRFLEPLSFPLFSDYLLKSSRIFSCFSLQYW